MAVDCTPDRRPLGTCYRRLQHQPKREFVNAPPTSFEIDPRLNRMSRITLQSHVTLDGVIESQPEALLPYMSDAGRQATLDLSLAADALLLGRTT